MFGIIDKATDPSLTSENWEFILDVCDKVNDDPEYGSKEAVEIIQNYLQTNVANRQIYSLILIDALAQNCGSKMHREIASRSFTTNLLEMVSEPSIHAAVKSKVMEVMKTLSREFRGDPSLRQMEDAFNKVKQQNPAFVAPEVPQKHQLSASERQKEEEDLQLALILSLQDAQPSFSPSSSSQAQKPQPQPQSQSQSQSQSQPQSQFGSQQQSSQQQSQNTSSEPETAKGKTAATVSRVRALYDLSPEDPGELTFRRGDVITVIESVYRDWWKGSLKGQVGIFPLNYVTPIPDPTPEELEQEARDEADVFAEAKNVEKLLAILSSAEASGSSNVAENEELQRLYHSTQAIRPRLVRLIEKYSQKRDDLIDLDKRFITARKTYDELIDSSLSHISVNPPTGQSPYGVPPQSTSYNSFAPNQPYDHRRSSSVSTNYQQQPPQQNQPVQQQQQQPSQQQQSQPIQPQLTNQQTGVWPQNTGSGFVQPLQPESTSHSMHQQAPSYSQQAPSYSQQNYNQQQDNQIPPAGTMPKTPQEHQHNSNTNNDNGSLFLPAGADLNSSSSYNYNNNNNNNIHY